MGLKSNIEDIDVWIRPANTLYGEQHYGFILAHVDNLLEISQYEVSVIK